MSKLLFWFLNVIGLPSGGYFWIRFYSLNLLFAVMLMLLFIGVAIIIEAPWWPVPELSSFGVLCLLCMKLAY